MKLGVSHSFVQSDDAVNIHPSRAELSFLSNAASTRALTRLPPTSPGARDVGSARSRSGRLGTY